ncbi:MAG TPA: CAP domain-containing protein, partial [Solirubrobacteraceae bacterium]|nr:CAP domain-containing protein [Solirubrobacteraceae bacterium]
MKPPVKLLLTALSILVPAALASTPAQANTSARHAHHGACTTHQRHHGQCKTVRRTRAHGRLEVRPLNRLSVSRPASVQAGSTDRATAAQKSAAVAAALAAPCANTELVPEEGNIVLVRAAVLCLVNRERAQNGVPPVSANAKLEAAAEEHCSELIADDYFAHVSPSGETPVDRIRGTGYIPGPTVGYVIGENLAWGTYSLSSAQSIVSAWIASPGHLANILESKYTETGIGITPAVPSSLAAGAPGATYA